MSQDDALRNLVDSSGFAFQVAVERLVSGTAFEVRASEHAWTHPNTQNSGFADIVLEKGLVRLVVECKRVRGGDWVFLRPGPTPDEASGASRRVDVLWTAVSPQQDATGTDAVFCTPETTQCPFCVIRGSGEGQQSMLERLAAQLLHATEAIAHEQKTLDIARREHLMPAQCWVYVPVIVTNARLSVCSFDPNGVNVADGSLPADATFESVTAVRFFKNLSFDIDTSARRTLTAANRAKNRTVLVVNATGFTAFLKLFSWEGGMPEGLHRFLT